MANDKDRLLVGGTTTYDKDKYLGRIHGKTQFTLVGDTLNAPNVNSTTITASSHVSASAYYGGTFTGTTISGTTAQFTTVTGSTVTGSIAKFTTVSVYHYNSFSRLYIWRFINW
jgi:hypothetical protein